MRIHILGICGTFMGSLALLLAKLGHEVAGSDTAIYPPMSTQLQNAGIKIFDGYCAKNLQPHPDVVVIGNALTRGVEAVEYVLNVGLRYISGPQMLKEAVLFDKKVLAVAGTHGKTTTTTMLAWILHQNGIDAGFLIGGVPMMGQGATDSVFSQSAHLGGEYFVVEADEYDSAFFDKRSKFVHYGARVVILNNLEFDHADIFDDLAAIERQFHHLVRIIPQDGLIVASDDDNLTRVLDKGAWTPIVRTHARDIPSDGVCAVLTAKDGTAFDMYHDGARVASVAWGMMGRHNVFNALNAITAAGYVGVSVANAAAALGSFGGIKRRMELVGVQGGIRVYDDFAHHPTAIATTLDGARAHLDGRIIAVIEARSNTMKMGVHAHSLAKSAERADAVFWCLPKDGALDNPSDKHRVFDGVEGILHALDGVLKSGDHVIVMSNGAFGGIHARILTMLQNRH